MAGINFGGESPLRQTSSAARACQQGNYIACVGGRKKHIRLLEKILLCFHNVTFGHVTKYGSKVFYAG